MRLGWRMRRFFRRSWTFLCVTAAIVALFVNEAQANSAVPQSSISLDKQNQTLVRVRLAKEQELLQFEVKDAKIFDRMGLQFSTTAKAMQLEVSKTLDDDLPKLKISGIKAKMKIPDHQLIYPIDLYGSQILLNGKPVPSPVRLILIEGQLSVLATLKMTDYLLGVLHREMSGLWPKEALKAQAIATRSYSIAQINSRTHMDFDLEGSVLDQEFSWVRPSDLKRPDIQAWQRALEETKEFILVTGQGETLKSYYHADCGGATTVPELVWGSAGEFQSVKDPSCANRKKNRWQLNISKSEIGKKLSSNPEGVFKFDWVKSKFDNRVTWVEWTPSFSGDQADSWHLISGQNFRRLLGFEILRSTKFKAEERGDHLHFAGQGFGHGVGLCQWGAKDWADKGWNVWKILNHYYPKAKIAFWRDSILAKKSEQDSEVVANQGIVSEITID